MINKWQRLSSNDKKKIYTVIVLILFTGLWTFYLDSFSSFMVYLSFILIIYPTQNSFQKKQLKEIHQMWELSEELQVSIETLSRVSEIGILDLKATKQEGSGIYIPPRKKILKTLDYLNQLKLKKDDH